MAATNLKRKSLHVPFSSAYPALQFKILSQCSTTRARASILNLPHGPVDTPVFMPVGLFYYIMILSGFMFYECLFWIIILDLLMLGTQGVMKGLTSEQMHEIGFQIMLGNTYHLANRPGADLIEDLGGIHEFNNYRGNVLTDSGGFQMVSLVKLSSVSEEGVTFKNPNDGSMMLLTPEKSIGLQNQIGSDIIMYICF